MTVGDASGILFEYSNGNMSMDVVLDLASGSKWPAVTALVACFAANNISLDDPLHKYLDWWSADPSDETSLVTIRHVLSMTTGMISDGGSIRGDPSTPFYNVSTVPERAFLLCSLRKGNVSTCAQAMYDAVDISGPLFAPGSKFMYSSFGFQWAAAAAEVVEGKSTDYILEHYLLGPAGMSPTCYWGNQELNPVLGGGLRCSARKLDLFVRGMLADKIVDSATRVEMETVQLVDPSMYGGATLFWGAYCLGNWLECLNNQRAELTSSFARQSLVLAGTKRFMPKQCFRTNRHGHPGCGGETFFSASTRPTIPARRRLLELRGSTERRAVLAAVRRTTGTTAGYYFNYLPSYTCNETNAYCNSPSGSSNCPALYGWAQTVRTASGMYLDDIFGVTV